LEEGNKDSKAAGGQPAQEEDPGIWTGWAGTAMFAVMRYLE